MDIPQDILDYCESCYKWDEDMRQEVYLKILELPPGTEINKGWCVAVYNNLNASDKRMEHRHKELERENADAIRAVFYEDNQAADPADVIEASEALSSRFADLSPLVRRTLEQYYVEGLTVEDIAALEWVDEEAIRKRITRGRNLLKGETQ